MVLEFQQGLLDDVEVFANQHTIELLFAKISCLTSRFLGLRNHRSVKNVLMASQTKNKTFADPTAAQRVISKYDALNFLLIIWPIDRLVSVMKWILILLSLMILNFFYCMLYYLNTSIIA